MAEGDLVEGQVGAVHLGFREIAGVTGVGHGRDLAAQVDHGLHVDHRLADLAVGEAEDGQGLVDALHDQDHRGHVARTDLALGRAMARQQRHAREARRHHRHLHDIQQDERGVGLDRRLGVGGQGLVVVLGRADLGPEALDRLVVHQGVDRAAGGLVVGLVEGAAVMDAPVGDGEGARGVEHHGEDRHRREAPVIGPRQGEGGHHQLQRRRGQVEHQGAQQVLDRAGAAVDGAAERPGALGLVVVERQAEGVGEALGRRAPLGRLGHRGEDSVARLGRGVRQEIQDGPADRVARESHEQGLAGPPALGQGVEHVAEHERRPDAEGLAGDDQDQGRGRAPPQARRVRAHDQTPEVGHGAPERQLGARRRVGHLALASHPFGHPAARRRHPLSRPGAGWSAGRRPGSSSRSASRRPRPRRHRAHPWAERAG